MNITYVTAWDEKGEAFNGRKIHDYLNAHGEGSQMIVKHKSSVDKNIHIVGNPVTRFFDQTVIAALEKLTGLWATFPISGWFTDTGPADLVHIQAIHGESFFSLLMVSVISQFKPVVYTVHDFWLMTGHCVYPMNCERWKTGCGNCPNINTPIKSLWDNTAFSWRIKNWIMHHSNVTLIVASKYMHQNVKQSPILKHLPIHIIPFGIKQKDYDKDKCRDEMGIPKDRVVVAYRVINGDDPFKGISFVQEALEQIKVLKVFPLPLSSEWEPDHEQVMKKLATADIFLMPSLAESFGLMAIESMSVGTPVICFDGTALPEVIGNGGITVQRTARSLVHAIRYLVNNPGIRHHFGDHGKRIVKEKYFIDRYINDHIALYKEMLA